MVGTIDLRQQNALRARQREARAHEASPAHDADPRNTATLDGKAEGEDAILISWSAPEYEHPERKPNWFLYPGAGALLLVLIGILIHSYFFVALVVLAYSVILMYAYRTPRDIEFLITHEGIYAGRALYRFSDIKTFWIFEAPSGGAELSLEIDRITMPYLSLPLGELHPNKIRAVLSDFLPEEKHKEFLSDHLARGLGF